MRRDAGAGWVLRALLCAASCLFAVACERATAAPRAPDQGVQPAPAAPSLDAVHAPAAEVSSASCVLGDATEQAALDALLAAVNDARRRGADCGPRGKQPPAPALVPSLPLRCAAQSHAYDMSTRGFFAHANPEGRRVRDRARAVGFEGDVGENLAWGQTTPEQVVDVWLKSPDHCHNMLRPQLTTAGAGFARSAAGKTFWVQVYGVSEERAPQ